MSLLGIGDLPSELTSRPLCLIALLGLDIVNNSVHASIWESFHLNRLPDRAPINFKLLEEGHQFPRAKPKRTSYERHVPKGLLKTNWLSKHLNDIPAVAVLFYKLDWDDPDWVEKRTECATKLEMLRSSLQGRNTKVVLALIQKTAPLPGGDDVIAAERAATLFSACDLSAKSLFVLPLSDHLFGYTLRLENAFYELAQSYYHQESRRIKNHREYLNKTTHQLLFVRHQFKIAFLSELKQDITTALKHYKQSYANLMEVRASDSNMLEVKTIAGFINYKICHLSFMLNTPLDSISQFRKHIDIFKSKIGSSDLAFEHSAWLSKQFSHFGDLFDEAVKQGLNPIQIQHPGFYYQQAANNAINRKLLCHKLCKNVKEYPNVDPLEGAENLEYYGQRPWRSGSQSIEPPDPQKEIEGIHALQYLESKQVDHSNIIIPLLSSAVAQFKKYRCPRMKRQLMVQMGEEYFSCKDYSKALTLFRHVLWDYRAEKWRTLVSSILNMALHCAYLTGDLEEYVTLGLEFTGNWIQASLEEKTIIQTSISNILSGKCPRSFPSTVEEDIISAEKLWQTAISESNLPHIFSIQMSSIIPFMECKVGFTSRTFSADERIIIKVYLRTNCSQPIRFSKLSVLFNNVYYNKFCEIPNEDKLSDRNTLYLQPRKTEILSFSFLPSPNDDKDIQISSVALQLGSENSICAILQWTVGNMDNQNSFLPWNEELFKEDINLQHLLIYNSTSIVPRQPSIQLNIDHQSPSLVNEFYAMSVEIINDELNPIKNVLLLVNLHDSSASLMEKTLFYQENMDSTNKEPSHFVNSIELGEISPSEIIKKFIFMKTNEVGTRNVIFKVTYDIEVEIDNHILLCHCFKEEKVNINIIEPMKFSVKLLNMKFQHLQQIRCEEPFLLKIDINSQCPLPLILLDGYLNLSSGFSNVDGEEISAIPNVTMDENEAASECFCIVTPDIYEKPSSIGTYILKWKRCSPIIKTPFVETVLNLPNVTVQSTPLFLQFEAPAHGWLRTPLTISYNLHNRTVTVQDIELFVDSSDAFMYAGNKQLHFRILPKSIYKLSYNLYPLISGYVPLPRLRLILNPGNSNAVALDDLMQEMLPSHIHIMPQGKNLEIAS